MLGNSKVILFTLSIIMLYVSQTALKVYAEPIRRWYPAEGAPRGSLYTPGDNAEEFMDSYSNGMFDPTAAKRAVRLMRLG
ncbi:unnamed protein product [Trichobilharzia szidati]|nr:unnamed protein product [Trichobilharzia szidati]